MTRTTNTTRRAVGAEFRAALWAVRHPGMVLTPITAGYSALEWGMLPTGSVLGGATLAALAWYRAHPGSFDHWAAPRVRAWRRRWLSAYTGPRWRSLMDAVDLERVHKKTGHTLYPGVVRVRAFSPNVDIVHVRMLKGQSKRTYQAKLEELADTLKVERVAIEATKPGHLALIVQRREAFTTPIPAPDMPATSAEVDPAALVIGEDEYGGDWTESVVGPAMHRLIAGATGAGKNSVVLAMLLGLAPWFRDGLAKLWIIDPKMMEFTALREVCENRYADNSADGVDLLQRYVDNMERTQKHMQSLGVREQPISREFPLHVLVVDELARLVAFADDGSEARAINNALAKITSMGRTTHHSVTATTIDPSKDVLDIRDLFPSKICLRVSSPTQPDMVLGAEMRERGAIADEIPNLPETAGIGYRVGERTRYPQRVRAAYTSDADMVEFVRFVTEGRRNLRSVA